MSVGGTPNRAILFGYRFLLTEGSSLGHAECKATANLLGPSPWQDMVDYAVLLGCENVD